jgi:ABC-2 type transport system ATP-binding protein
MSIIANSVTKLYGSQRAIDEVNFEIQAGEVVGFLGPNGAGKSTMMKIISCYIPPTSGQVSVNGLDVLDHPLEVKKLVGYLPEHNPLYLDMYVREYLEFVAGVYGLKEKSKQVSRMIEKVGLGVEQHKLIGALSKGYRQRVGLAQAMIHDPEVLILDEPTSGLDPNQLVEIRKLIAEIGKEKTVMLSTHIMQEVEAICNRVMIINKGQIVADAPASTIRDIGKRGMEQVKIEFDGDVTQEQLTSIPGVKSAKELSNKTWLLETEGDKEVRQKIFNWAVQNELSVLTMNKEDIRLEDVFKELTGNIQK